MFNTTANIIGTESQASATMYSYVPGTQKIVDIVVTPNPANSNGQLDFGFSTSIDEWPNV